MESQDVKDQWLMEAASNTEMSHQKSKASGELMASKPTWDDNHRPGRTNDFLLGKASRESTFALDQVSCSNQDPQSPGTTAIHSGNIIQVDRASGADTFRSCCKQAFPDSLYPTVLRANGVPAELLSSQPGPSNQSRASSTSSTRLALILTHAFLTPLSLVSRDAYQGGMALWVARYYSWSTHPDFIVLHFPFLSALPSCPWTSPWTSL